MQQPKKLIKSQLDLLLAIMCHLEPYYIDLFTPNKLQKWLGKSWSIKQIRQTLRILEEKNYIVDTGNDVYALTFVSHND